MARPSIKIRVYNVRFGDCVLVSLGLAQGEKHVLVDFGNALGGVRNKGGLNDVFAPVAADIAERTRKTIDLLVMSHEHLDHMEGFYSQKKVFDRIAVKDVWMPLMSAPDYLERYPACKPEMDARVALNDLATRWSLQGRLSWLPDSVLSLIDGNALSLSNAQRIDYLRGLPGDPKRVHYLARGDSVKKRHTLGNDVAIEVLAPERDASVYYGEGGPEFWLGAAGHFGTRSGRRALPVPRGSGRCPRHVAPEEFEQLRDDVAELDVGDLLALDKAANNKSLVLRISVEGTSLLFPGDAEPLSWSLMKSKGLLKPVDVLKVAHHGSANGMPFKGGGAVAGLLLKPGGRTAAIVSTWRGVYGESRDTEIPNADLLAELKRRCGKVIDTEKDAGPGEFVEYDLAE